MEFSGWNGTAAGKSARAIDSARFSARDARMPRPMLLPARADAEVGVGLGEEDLLSFAIT